MITITIDTRLKTCGLENAQGDVARVLRELAERIEIGSFLPAQFVDRRGNVITIIQE